MSFLGHDIDDVYNTKFLIIKDRVLNETRKSIERLSNNSVEIINLVIPKPDIPPDIAENYKQVQNICLQCSPEIK